MISPTSGTVSHSRHRAFRSPHREAARQGVRPPCFICPPTMDFSRHFSRHVARLSQYVFQIATFPDIILDACRAKPMQTYIFYRFPTLFPTHVGQIHSTSLYTVALDTPSVFSLPSSTRCFKRLSAVLSIKPNCLAN